MVKSIITSGQRFGRWTILIETSAHKQPNGKLCRAFTCLCDCGNQSDVLLHTLRNGRSMSCGCYMKEVNGKRIGEKSRTHGNTPVGENEYKSLFFVWNSIKQRCYNPNSSKYYIYGGNGIKVCDEWINDFTKFRDWSVSNGYFKQSKDISFKDKLSIDRLDSKGNYNPVNCRWITISENSSRRHYK